MCLKHISLVIWSRCCSTQIRQIYFYLYLHLHMAAFTDHALEKAWWPDHDVKLDSLPTSSRCFLKLTPNKGIISIQVAQYTCSLPLRWRPIFTLIDLCQLECLHQIRAVASTSGTTKDAVKTVHIHSKLLLWYDQLRRYIIVEAEKRDVDQVKDNFWIPPVVHRFCVRTVVGMSHQPRMILKKFEDLQKMYCITVWSYG